MGFNIKYLKKINNITNQEFFIVCLLIIVIICFLITKKEKFIKDTIDIKKTKYKFKECIDNETSSCYFNNIYLLNKVFYIVTDNTEDTILKNNINNIDLISYGGIKLNYSLISHKEFIKLIENKEHEIINELCIRYNTAWRHNPGHALWESLYSAYVLLLNYNMEHSNFYNVLLENDKTDENVQSSDFLKVFSGLDDRYFYWENISNDKIYVFRNLLTGIGKIGQRIYEYPVTMNIPGNIRFNAVKKFVERFYKKYEIGEHNQKINDIIKIIIIDNKRFTDENKTILKNIVNYFNKFKNIEMSYIDFKNIPSFKDQLKLVSETNIYISSVGTGLMLHPFLRPGSIVINLGVKKNLK